MRGTASASAAVRRSSSLIDRLAVLESAQPNGDKNAPDPYWASLGVYFGIGLLSGGAVGAAALVALQFSGNSLWHPPAGEVPAAIAALAPWVPEPAKSPHAAVPAVPAPDAFDVVVDRKARGGAPFGLRLVGADNDALEVLLRDVPAPVEMSRGQRRDASTWAVRAADLESLRLTLGDGAPDAFNVRIEVLTPPGMTALGSIARVRVVDIAGAEHEATTAATALRTEAAKPDRVLFAPDPPHETQSVSNRNPPPAPRERVVRISPSPLPKPAVEPEQQQPSVPKVLLADERHWPEGASGLGAMARASDRRVWWTLPAPTAWSPFKDTAGR